MARVVATVAEMVRSKVQVAPLTVSIVTVGMLVVMPMAAGTNAVWGSGAAFAANPALATGWNDAQIAWRSYEDGLAEAKRSGKPVMVVVHTTWCPYCKQYQTLFKDPRVVAAASRLVLVMVDRDQDKELNVRLGPPGQTYIPRTLFLTPAGALMADVAVPTAGREHLVDYYDPDELLSLMAKAAEHSPPR